MCGDAPTDRLALELRTSEPPCVAGVEASDPCICRKLGLERWRRRNREMPVSPRHEGTRCGAPARRGLLWKALPQRASICHSRPSRRANRLACLRKILEAQQVISSIEYALRIRARLTQLFCRLSGPSESLRSEILPVLRPPENGRRSGCPLKVIQHSNIPRSQSADSRCSRRSAPECRFGEFTFPRRKRERSEPGANYFDV